MASKPLTLRAVKDVSVARTARVLADLHARTFSPTVPFPGVWPAYWWVVYDGKKPAAFAFMCGSDRYADTGYFGRVGVLPEYRGRGLQRRLMRAAERKARALGWIAMVSDTRNKPYSAANFKALGYEQFTPENPWDFPCAIYWRKEL